MDFLCSQCSACCRNIGHLNLPHNGDGICLNLDKKTNKCLIYETRPDICRVNKMFEKHFKTKMTKKEFYIINTEACHKLIEKEGLDNSYKIDIKEYN
jgi:hypothetical protein